MIKTPNKRISELGLEGINASQYDAVNILEDIVEKKRLKILRTTILASPKGLESKHRKVGEGKCRIEITPEVVSVPRTSHIITEEYPEEDLLYDLKEMKKILIKEYPEYNVRMYIDSIELLDRGDPITRNELIVVFNKTDTVDPNSEIGKLLGNETMPLDLVGIYRVITTIKKDKDKETGEVIEKVIYKKGIPIREISVEKPFVEAKDAYRYTRNLYDSDFLMVRKCEIKVEMKTIPIYTSIPEALCSEDEKYPEGLIEEVSEEILGEENETLKPSKELSENKNIEQKSSDLHKQIHKLKKERMELTEQILKNKVENNNIK